MVLALLKMGFVRGFGLKLVGFFLDKVVWPAAEKYVAKTTNTYDNIALENAKRLVSDVIKEFGTGLI